MGITCQELIKHSQYYLLDKEYSQDLKRYVNGKRNRRSIGGENRNFVNKNGTFTNIEARNNTASIYKFSSLFWRFIHIFEHCVKRYIVHLSYLRSGTFGDGIRANCLVPKDSKGKFSDTGSKFKGTDTEVASWVFNLDYFPDSNCVNCTSSKLGASFELSIP